MSTSAWDNEGACLPIHKGPSAQWQTGHGWRRLRFFPALGTHTYCFPNFARASKVDDLDGGPLRVLQQNILGLEITVDDADLIREQKVHRAADLLRKLAYKVKRDALEVGVPDQVVQVVRQELKHQAQVIPVLKVAEKPHCTAMTGMAGWGGAESSK